MAVDIIVGPISEQAYQNALSVIAADERRIAVELAEQVKSQIAVLEQQAAKAAKGIDVVKGQEPEAWIIKTRYYKEAHAAWEVRMKDTIKAHDDLLRQIESARSGPRFKATQQEIDKLAKRTSKERNPVAMEVTRDYEADREIEKLTARLSEVERDIKRVRDTGEENRLPELLRDQSRVLGRLMSGYSLGKRLDGKSKEVFVAARRVVDKELSVFKDRDRGMGL